MLIRKENRPVAEHSGSIPRGESMISQLKKSALFTDMTDQEIEGCLKCSKSIIAAYEKEEMIFRQGEIPEKLFVLLEGAVVVGNDSGDGKRSVVAALDQPGELFGEVFLFLNQQEYDHHAQAVTVAKVLQIPRDFLYHTCGENCHYHAKLISNMLTILARKAYFLNQRLQILTCATLRQKIAKTLLMHSPPDGKVVLSMNREELADFLNAARPSVSRELMKMREEGLIAIDRKDIFIVNLKKLQDML